ncbi:MAG TPA: redoxin family protein [Acidimicrobiales bacterium]|nr:redoxin family protein [Acidimicrobiales bacterium]
MNRRYLFAAIGLALVALVAVLVAKGTDPNRVSGVSTIHSAKDLPVIEHGPLPSLDAGNGFIGAAPNLKGKVVLYDFWTYSCVNCVRTLPYIESWYSRYAPDGLVVVGVHSPEFDFEKIHHNVAAAVKKLHVNYPVVFDDDMAIWNAFHNQYWPAKYLADRDGDLRYVHFGEGGYLEAEDAIRALLGVAKDAPRAADPNQRQESLTAANTPETYLGSERGGDDIVKLTGRWSTTDQYIESKDAHEYLKLSYHAGEVNLVLDRSRENPTYAVVELDGKPVAAENRGASIVERDGQTVVDIDAADLYHLIAHGPKGNHILTFHPGGAGVQAFAFTFGD